MTHHHMRRTATRRHATTQICRVRATAAGAITPAGPFVSMPLAAGMLRAGAGAAAVITFVSAWGLLAIHRLIAWEIPILGAGFAISRWMLCLVLPPIVGLLARALLRS